VKIRSILQTSGLLCGMILSGCVSFQVAGDIQQGRVHLMRGNPKAALAHFERAAQVRPDYLLNYSMLNQGVWTYVGRAHYDSKNFAEARQALEKARSRYDHDHLAKIYLGLVLGRSGDQKKGLTELEAGMTGLRDWLNYIHYNTFEGNYWDPAMKIRSEINRDLTMIASGKVNWEALTASAEWIGHKTEVEVDVVKRDIYRDETRDGDDPWD